MKTKIYSLKKHISFSNFWIRNGLIIIVLSILVNHLTKPENFPFHSDYKFPLLPIIISIIAGSIVIFITGFNFDYYKNKYFTKRINTQLLTRFLFSTLGYITILYLIFYFSLNGVINGTKSYSIYHLLTGLSVTLLINTLLITILLAPEIYKLNKIISKKGTLKVQQSGKIKLVKYTEIAFIYSENKIVYIVKTDGTIITTDFTLNEVENEISEQNFYRANRQTIIHPRSIEQINSIENGKLSVLLKPTTSNKKAFKINISRYKKQEFMTWFNTKL